MSTTDFAPRSLKKAIKKIVSSTSRGRKKQELSTEEMYKLVQLKAYELYEKRGGGHGADVEDWVEAENQVRSQYESVAV